MSSIQGTKIWTVTYWNIFSFISTNPQFSFPPSKFGKFKTLPTLTSSDQILTALFSGSSINLFLANVPILYPLQIAENRWLFWCFQGRFSGIFRRYKMGTLARNRLTWGKQCGEKYWLGLNLVEEKYWSSPNNCLFFPVFCPQ